VASGAAGGVGGSDVVVRRVAVITMLTAVLSPVTGVLLLGGRILLRIESQSATVLERLDRLGVFIIYALFYTGPPALLFAALGSSVLFALSVHGLPRRVLLLAGCLPRSRSSSLSRPSRPWPFPSSCYRPHPAHQSPHCYPTQSSSSAGRRSQSSPFPQPADRRRPEPSLASRRARAGDLRKPTRTRRSSMSWRETRPRRDSV
jgi:hypothetical protein